MNHIHGMKAEEKARQETFQLHKLMEWDEYRLLIVADSWWRGYGRRE